MRATVMGTSLDSQREGFSSIIQRGLYVSKSEADLSPVRDNRLN